MNNTPVGLFQIIESEAFINWFLSAVVILIVVYLFTYTVTKAIYLHRINTSGDAVPNDEMAMKLACEPERVSQILFEIIISNSCIIASFWLYYWLIAKLSFLGGFSSYILLALIICAIKVNDIIDEKLGQDMLSDDDRVNIRLLCSLAIIVVLVYLVIEYKSESYSDFLSCYLALVLGRFIFFDSRWAQSVRETLKPCIHVHYLLPLLADLIFTYVVFKMGLRFSLITVTNILDGLVLVHICLILSIGAAKYIIKIFQSGNY